ncbi:MAG: hypothetical protein AAGD38_01875 [Acidobacteriota bacterium]
MSFSLDQPVHVLPFSRQIENGEAVIGRPETGVFLALPEEALEILDDLAAGHTVSEARRAFASKHGETPDMIDLLEHLADHGLVSRPGESKPTDIDTFDDQFGWIPRGLARAFFTPIAWVVYGLSVALAVVAVVLEPSIVPGWRAAYFPRDTALLLIALMFLGLLTTFFHELGHVLAARAQGVATRFGIGNRLWFVVWETDMTGVWALPRRRRYLPILAGPLVDLVSASWLVLIGFAIQQELVTVTPRALQIVRALLLVYLMRLLWQAYFFVRTDYYYAITNALGCKSLMADTEAFLGERWARLRGRRPESSLAHLSARERRAVRGYSVVWLLGRGVAVGVLLLIQLPLFIGYGGLLVSTISSGQLADAETTSWLPVAMFLLFFGIGMTMWIRGMLRSETKHATLAGPRRSKRSSPASHPRSDPSPLNSET